MANANLEKLSKFVWEEVSVTVVDDTDVTLPINMSGKQFVAAIPVDWVFSSGASINYYVANATGTAVVMNCSTTTASASGTVRFAVAFMS